MSIRDLKRRLDALGWLVPVPQVEIRINTTLRPPPETVAHFRGQHAGAPLAGCWHCDNASEPTDEERVRVEFEATKPANFVSLWVNR